MRLIDADALKQECMYIDGIPAVTERDIDNAPTIEAIPVEWLKQRTKHPDSYTQGSAKWMLGCWKREQEAR